jgi:ABC-2 type transport system permease protein
MKRHLAFARVSLVEQWEKLLDVLGTVFSFCIHIVIFSFLWEFVLEGKALAGYTRQELIWYVIMAEAIMYSFHHYYRKVANKVEMGDFAYDMTKPFNFLTRTVVEGLAELPMTFALLMAGSVLGIIFAGVLPITILQFVISLMVMLVAAVLLLVFNILVGLLAIWLGRDVSSVWILCQKAMLIFAFTPIELFPKWAQNILMLLPTTHVIYTPASLFVHFSVEKLIISVVSLMASLALITLILWVIYKKGVRKQNVNGI